MLSIKKEKVTANLASVTLSVLLRAQRARQNVTD